MLKEGDKLVVFLQQYTPIVEGIKEREQAIEELLQQKKVNLSPY